MAEVLLEKFLGGLTALWSLLHHCVHTNVLCSHVLVLRQSKLYQCLALRLCQQGRYWPAVTYFQDLHVLVLIVLEMSLMNRWLIFNLNDLILYLALDHLFELVL